MEQNNKSSIATWIFTFAVVAGIASLITRFLNPTESMTPTYLLIFAGVLLLLAIIFGLKNIKEFFSKRTTLKGLTSIITFVILIGILVALYVVAKNHPKRVDMTEEKKYSLAKQTVEVLKDLKSKYRVLVMGKEGEENPFTRQPILNPQMVELLKSYKNKTDKLEIEYTSVFENPELMKKYNLQQGDGLGALIIEKLDDKGQVVKNITILQRELVEYSYQGRQPTPKFVGESKLTSVLAGFGVGKQNVIYITEGHSERSFDAMDEENFGKLKDNIKLEGYELKTVNLKSVAEVPSDASMLLIAGPQTAFSQAEVAKLKAYFDRGGRTLLLLDPAIQKVQSGLEGLLKKYSITIDNSYVLEGDPNAMVKNIFNQAFANFHLGQFGFHKIVDQLNQNNSYIFFLFSQPFIIDQKNKPASVTITPLMSTTSSAWGEKGGVKNQFDAGKDTKGPLDIAFAITDNFGKKETDKEMRLVVIGDTDFIKNGFSNQGGAYNNGRDFFLNSIGWLTQQEKKITIRPKENKQRNLMMTSQRAGIIFIITVIIIPFGIVGLGILYNKSRKRNN